MGNTQNRSKAISLEGNDVYDIYLHTGNRFPQKNTIKKWHQGPIKITINPGANEDEDSEFHESRELVMTGRFSKDYEGAVLEEFWIPIF